MDNWKELITQMNQNSTIIASVAKAVEFNAAEVKDCKSKLSGLENQTALHMKQ